MINLLCFSSKISSKLYFEKTKNYMHFFAKLHVVLCCLFPNYFQSEATYMFFINESHERTYPYHLLNLLQSNSIAQVKVSGTARMNFQSTSKGISRNSQETSAFSSEEKCILHLVFFSASKGTNAISQEQ